MANFGQPELPAAKNFQVLWGNFDVCKEFVTEQNSLRCKLNAEGDSIKFPGFDGSPSRCLTSNYGFRTFYKHPQGPEYWLNNTVCIKDLDFQNGRNAEF